MGKLSSERLSYLPNKLTATVRMLADPVGDLDNIIPEPVFLGTVYSRLGDKLRGLCLQSTGSWKEMKLTR